ncbi:MAG: hypothetical protein L0387_08465 [Acidobacteria bacterium]|nr:hypothetical protein [Acidobacteriota bacterium]MCI0621687.1 hypothetical protein [Acidobacteriota bacterium]MCI0724271.1 hypothetical protein [Acidobacteriota bacterium]
MSITPVLALILLSRISNLPEQLKSQEQNSQQILLGISDGEEVYQQIP